MGYAENDGDYCPSCKRVILDALASVPEVKKRFWQVVEDAVEHKAVLAERERLRKDPPRLFGDEGPPIYQYRPGLIDIHTGAQEHVDVVHLKGAEYDVHEWPDNRKSIRIEKHMERDLRTGAVRP